MKKATWYGARRAACGLIVACLACTVGHAAVTADPAKATFTSLQQSATISLTGNGAPIPAKDIRGWQFIASDHDYKHMINVEKMDGALRIAPSKTMEVGSYDLKIDTAQGSVTVLVLAPLSDLPDIVEKTAALSGQSEQKIKEKMGMSTTIRSESSQLELPPVYYEGQTLELTLPAKPGSTCTWFMNGDVVAEGPGLNTLAYTFKEPGEYILTYIETDADTGKGATATRAVAHTRVVPMPATPTEVAVNTKTTFAPPSGYQKHVWRIDGQEVSTEPSLEHTFKEPGVHTVECLATAPATGPAQGFLRIRYSVTVKSI